MRERAPMPDITERVKAGAALLDERLPGWNHRVDPDRLDLETEDCCILGQLFGLFKHGLDGLKLPRNYLAPGSEAVPYGFDLGRDMSKREYPALTAAWRALILARQNEIAPWQDDR